MQIGLNCQSTFESATDEIEPGIVVLDALVVELDLRVNKLLLAGVDLALWGWDATLRPLAGYLLVKSPTTCQIRFLTIDLGALARICQSFVMILDRRLRHRRVLDCLNR